MIYNKIFVMKKLLTIISVIGAAILAVSGCSKTDVSVEAGGEGGDEGEQTVEIVPAEGSVNLDEFSDYIVSVEDDAIWFHPTEEGTGSVSKAQTKGHASCIVGSGSDCLCSHPERKVSPRFSRESRRGDRRRRPRQGHYRTYDYIRVLRHVPVSGSFEMEMESDEGVERTQRVQ